MFIFLRRALFLKYNMKVNIRTQQRLLLLIFRLQMLIRTKVSGIWRTYKYNHFHMTHSEVSCLDDC